MTQKIKDITPGFLCCLALSFLAIFIGTNISFMGALTSALCIGSIVSNTINVPHFFQPGIHFCAKKILNFNVVLLGLSINAKIISEQSPGMLFKLSLIVFGVILISYFIGKLLGLDSSFSLLIGIGTGICGTAAIAATSYLITDKKEDIGNSTGIIHLLGIVFLISLPLLLVVFSETDHYDLGLLIGGSLQAVGHVIAAGDLFEPAARELAITIKMARVSLLIPLVIGLSFWKSYKISGAQKPTFLQILARIPFYIYAFILAICITQISIISPTIISKVQVVTHFLMGISMVAIGFSVKINRSSLIHLQKGLILGVLIFFILFFGVFLIR